MVAHHASGVIGMRQPLLMHRLGWHAEQKLVFVPVRIEFHFFESCQVISSDQLITGPVELTHSGNCKGHQ
jgi:hypothetical protein